MMLFGGERDGQTLNEMWRFHFGEATSSFTGLPFKLTGFFFSATEFWERLSIASTEAKPMPRSQTTAFIFSQFTTRGAVHYMGLPEQEYFGSQPAVADQKKLTSVQPNTLKSFASNGDSSAVDNDDIYEEIDDYKVEVKGTKFTFSAPETCLDDRPQRSNFQRLDSGQKTAKKFALSRLSQLSCRYSMFSNESTESLNTMGPNSTSVSNCYDDDEEDVTEEISPSASSIRLKKSHSSSFSIQKDVSKKNSPPSSGISRDPVSVPNLASLILNNRKDIPEVADSIELLDFTEQVPESVKDSPQEGSKTFITEAIIETVNKSDSSYTFQSYDCSSRSASTEASKSNKAATKLVDLESSAMSDDYSSLSGYESIESNYEVALSKKVEDMKAKFNEGKLTTSFANPHYLCPEVQTIVESKNNGMISKYGEKLNQESLALNSPAESLISDYHDFQARLNRDFVEPKPKKFSLRPRSAHFQPTILESLSSNHYYQSVDNEENEDLIPKSEKVEVPLRKKAMTPQLGRKSSAGQRPLSTGSPKVQRRALPQQPSEKQLKLFMYIVGGREVGQVTVFRRPVSMWRLDLTKTF